eukprot:gene14158-biopygen21618
MPPLHKSSGQLQGPCASVALHSGGHPDPYPRGRLLRQQIPKYSQDTQQHILPDLRARACNSTHCSVQRNSRYRAPGVACVQRNSRKSQMQRTIGRYGRGRREAPRRPCELPSAPPCTPITMATTFPLHHCSL